MLKKSASFVLASLRGSPYGTEYALPLCSLRPTPWKRRISARLGWAGEKVAFLTILRGILMSSPTIEPLVSEWVQNSFSTAC